MPSGPFRTVEMRHANTRDTTGAVHRTLPDAFRLVDNKWSWNPFLWVMLIRLIDDRIPSCSNFMIPSLTDLSGAVRVLSAEQRHFFPSSSSIPILFFFPSSSSSQPASPADRFIPSDRSPILLLFRSLSLRLYHDLSLSLYFTLWPSRCHQFQIAQPLLSLLVIFSSMLQPSCVIDATLVPTTVMSNNDAPVQHRSSHCIKIYLRMD